jgi:hypothetical protein
MEAIIFSGLPGSGKSSFYKERFFNTHVRISLDLLKTRYRETRILEACLETDQRFVIDNTNPTKPFASTRSALAICSIRVGGDSDFWAAYRESETNHPESEPRIRNSG